MPPHRPPAARRWARHQVRPGARLVTLLLLSALAGCGDPPPALSFGPVDYPDEAVRGLGPEQIELLGAVTAVGLAAARAAPAEAGTHVLARGHREDLVLRLREETILAGAGVTEDELRARYAAAPDHELEVRHLVLLAPDWATSTDRERARQGAAAARERILAGEPFEAVAAEVSEEPGAADRGGLLRPGRRGTWVEPFWQAASALPVGGVSPVVETSFGFHVLRLESRTELPFAEARARVVREVAATLGGGEAWEDARERWVAEVAIAPAESAPRPRFQGLVALARGGPDVVPDPEAALATWPGGALSAEDFRRALLARPAPELRRLAGDPTALEAVLAEEAETARLAAEARARGLAPTPADRDTRLREWETRMVEWTAFLGFREGLTPSEVAEAALAALRTTGQNARIAREGVGQAAPALLGSEALLGPEARSTVVPPPDSETP
jgi:hypothetical protein